MKCLAKNESLEKKLMKKRLKIRSGREKLAASLFMTGLLLVGCKPPVPNSGATASSQPEKKALVTVGIVRVQVLTSTVELPATIESDETAKLMPRVEAYVAEVLVDIGDQVEAGQVLVRLDAQEIKHGATQAHAMVQQLIAHKEVLLAELGAANAQLQVIHAELSLKNSERDLTANLVGSGAMQRQRLLEAESAVQSTAAMFTKYENAVKVSEAKLLKGQSEMAVAQAKAQAADSLVGYLEIKAPFTGIVAERNIDVGNLVRPSGSSDMKPLLTVVKIDTLRAVVHATSDVAGQLVVGQPVKFQADDVPGKVFEGRLSRMAGTYHRKTRMMQAEVDLDNAADATGHRPLRAGSYGLATIVLQSASLPVVPMSAIRTRGDRTSVLVVRGAICSVVPVTIAFTSGEQAAIAEGLAGGEKVLADPAEIQDEEVLKNVEIKTVSW